MGSNQWQRGNLVSGLWRVPWILEHADAEVVPRSRQFLSTTFKDQGGEECSDSLASLTRSPVSSAGRASDLLAEGRGFESYTG